MKKVISYLEEIRQVRMDYMSKQQGNMLNNKRGDITGSFECFVEIKLIDEITRDIKNL
jgi:hypothetical protein